MHIHVHILHVWGNHDLSLRQVGPGQTLDTAASLAIDLDWSHGIAVCRHGHLGGLANHRLGSFDHFSLLSLLFILLLVLDPLEVLFQGC